MFFIIALVKWYTAFEQIVKQKCLYFLWVL